LLRMRGSYRDPLPTLKQIATFIGKLPELLEFGNCAAKTGGNRHILSRGTNSPIALSTQEASRFGPGVDARLPVRRRPATAPFGDEAERPVESSSSISHALRFSAAASA